MEGIWPGHRGYIPTLYEKCHGIFNYHRKSGPRFNVSSCESVYTGRDKATFENHLKFVSVCHKQNAAAVYCWGFVVSRLASGVDTVSEWMEPESEAKKSLTIHTLKSALTFIKLSRR